MLNTLLLVGIVIVVIPPLLQRIHIDVRGGEVLIGMVAAVFLPGLAEVHWLTVVAEIGLLVLMFEIGLDIDLDRLQEDMETSLKFGALSFIVPFLAAFAAVYWFTGSLVTGLVVGTGLSSTALAVVIPLMEREGIDSPLVKNASMFSEVIGISLLMAFVRARTLSADSILTEAFAIIGFVTFTVFLVPKVMEKLKFLDRKKLINFETKFMLFVVFGIAVVSDALGIHAATGAFLAGLFLSESTHRGLAIEERIKPITELLVPVFFFHVGYQVEAAFLTATTFYVAAGLAALVLVVRSGAFRLLAHRMSVPYRPELVSLFAPCMTVTATAAQIGLESGVLSASWFTMFLVAGLFLTIGGPLISKLVMEYGR